MTRKFRPRRSAGSVLYVGEIKVGDEVKSFELKGTHLLSLRWRLMKLVSFDGGFSVMLTKSRPTLSLKQPVNLEVSIKTFKRKNHHAEAIVMLLLREAEYERKIRLINALEYYFSLSNERRYDYFVALECMEQSIVSARGFPLTTRRILHDVYCQRAYEITREDVE